MSKPGETPMDSLLTALERWLRSLIREEIQAVYGQNGNKNKKPVETANPYLTAKEPVNLSRLGSSTIRLYILKPVATLSEGLRPPG